MGTISTTVEQIIMRESYNFMNFTHAKAIKVLLLLYLS